MRNTLSLPTAISLVRATLLAGVAAAAGGAWAQPAWPAKPISIVVAYPAGGDTDAVARLLAEKLSTRLKQPVLVDNRPGASGVIGSSFVGKALPDGYTLLMAPSTFTMAQLVLKTGPGSSYDVRAFTPIFQVGAQPLFLVAGGGTKLQSVSDAVRAGKSAPLTYASPGSGSPMHVLGEMFNKAAGTSFKHVPYRGVAPALTDVVGGHVPLTWITYGPVEPYLKDGKIRLLGVAQAERSALAPSVPTLAEQGVAGVGVTAWNGLYGPKGLPANVTQTLNKHLNEIIREPEVAQRMRTLGMIPVGGTPETLSKTTIADLERFTQVVKDLGIQAD